MIWNMKNLLLCGCLRTSSFTMRHEVNHLCKTVYADFIHKQLENTTVEDVDVALDQIHAQTMFTGLGKVGESGAMVMYLFRTANNIGIR